MAGIAAKFEADFSQFSREVAKADAGLKVMASTSAGTNSAIGNLHQGLSDVDRIMASLGVNIGPQVQALREFSAVSGKTASQLGVVATAGLAASAAFAGWQIGRYVADWLDLDDAIGKATASLLGWGDAAAEAAGANMDVLARASVIAKTQITDLTVALEIIRAANARMNENFNTGAERVKSWNKEIADVKAAGNLPALRAEMEAGNSTMEQMKSHFNISIEALQFYKRQLTETGAEQKKFAAEAREAWVRMARAQDELRNAGDGWKNTLDAIDPALVKVIQSQLAMGVSAQSLAVIHRLSVKDIEAVGKGFDALVASMARAEAKMIDSSNTFGATLVRNGAGYLEQSAQQVKQMQDMIVLAQQLDQEFNAKAGPTSGETLDSQIAGFESMRGQDGFSDAWINQKLNELLESFRRKEGAAGNLPGTSYAPPGVWDPSKYHSSPTSGMTTINNINMTGILATSDPSGRAALRSAVDEALIAGAKQGRKF